MKSKPIAFYLPQFHPIPENDAWWGKGFTEWTNVAAARPRFHGHYQPHIPQDVGFYDLRVNETRELQAELAREYGVYGFCYYHYWFAGKTLLDRPLRALLATQSPDFPFCICWANENWTRAWDGRDREVLIKQNYSDEDSRNHIAHLVRIMDDRRYIQVSGRPMLLIYRADVIPNVEEMILLWRDYASKYFSDGLYIVGVRNSFSTFSRGEYRSKGFDAVVDFQPNKSDFPIARSSTGLIKSVLEKVLPDEYYQRIKLAVSANNVIEYRALIEKLLARDWPNEFITFPCIFPSWDNSARRKSATIIQNLDGELFERWVKKACQDVSAYEPAERFIFVNAWNEWAEGCHLEPDLKNGRMFLQALASGLC